MAEKIAVIISKARAAEPTQEKLQQDLVAELRKWHQVAVTVVPHLYDLAPNGPAVERLQAVSGDLIVLSHLYPRAAYWVLDANGVKGRLERTSSLPAEDYEEASAPQEDDERAAERALWCFDLRTHDQPEPYLAEMAGIVAAAAGPVEVESSAGSNGQVKIVDEATRERWYPVIDFGRCENCMECLNFCLFGVFGLDAQDHIVAEQPDACRPGCPACSRICPKGAIMFPQHHDPAIAGDPAASREGLKLDLSQLFRGAGAAEIAAAERERHLAEKRRQDSAAEEADRPPLDKGPLDDLVDEVDDMDL